jgi:hypothetical protein
MSHLTEGIAGDELMRRRSAGLCTACGVTPVFAVNASRILPWLCARCRERVPKKPRFNTTVKKPDARRDTV